MAMTSEGNNRSLLYKISGILMLAVSISMMMVLISSIETIQSKLPIFAPMGVVALIIAIIFFALSYRVRRKHRGTENLFPLWILIAINTVTIIYTAIDASSFGGLNSREVWAYGTVGLTVINASYLLVWLIFALLVRRK